MDWISVEKEWPPSGDWVILGGGDAGVEQGFQLDGKQFYLCRTDGYDDPINVHPTHWMPLPSPPTVACGKKDGRRARNGGYSAACVKPKGHNGNHEDCYGCWWI